MRKITSLFVVIVFSAFIQSVYPNTLFGLIELVTGLTKIALASSTAPSLPKAADKEKPGFPYVSYDDPVAAVGTEVDKRNATAIAAATADFDSDGVQDLISIDGSGTITFFKGNADTIFPNSIEAKERSANGTVATAFSTARNAASVPVAADDIFAGDFNADAAQDVLVFEKARNALYLLSGTGTGEFSLPIRIDLDGQVTSAAVGEIGRPDGQTDVAVGTISERGAMLVVFEHPEGAFSHKPEIFPILQPVVSISIGQFDSDPYGDIAIGGGETLTVIHGRGQAYPLDMLPEADIQRPAAVVRSMRLDFTVRSLVTAEMEGTRGDGIAMLATDGSVRYFKAGRNAAQTQARPKATTAMESSRFAPVGVDPGKLVASKQTFPQTEADADAAGLLMANTDEIKSKGLTKVLEEKALAMVAERAKIPADKLAADDAAKAARHAEVTAERKRLFEEGLAAKPIDFTSWKMTTLTVDARLASAAASGSARLFKARVSSSGVDDLLISDAMSNGINVVGRWLEENEKATGRGHVVQIETNANPTTVIPMRLNSDGRSDLVMFGSGSAAPDVLMSLPPAILTVNTVDDVGGGNCQNDGQICGLRRAVFWANLIPDSVIAFNIPGTGVQTIHLTSPLADLVRPVTIDGTTQPGYVNKPLIEIKGDVVAASGVEGFRVTTSNIVIRGLVINKMPGLQVGGSVIGGSGIVMLSYIGRSVTTNTTIESNFLGTDPTGTQASGNDGNGVQIYNADNNLIGGTIPLARNILSGNGNYVQNLNGVGLAITGGNNNRVFNNYLGTDVTGTLRLSNSYGAFITGANNQIGGDQPGTGNLISGNGTPPDELGRCGGQGLAIAQLYSADYAEPLTNNTMVKGNLVGTNASGFAALSNCTTGIAATGNINTSIGSITSAGRNTVSGNKYDGIWCGFNDSVYFPSSGACYISGNNIGTNVTGNAAIPNTGENSCVGFCLVTDTVWTPIADIDFVVVGSPGGTTPNGPCTGLCNLISGNYGPWLNGGGVAKSGGGLGLIVNNYIGTNRSGDAALPNFSAGGAYYGSALIGVTFSDGQGGFVPGGNLISGNSAAGTYIQAIDGGGLFWIKGNTFGLSADGLSSIPNGITGSESNAISVLTQGGTSVSIGGTAPTDRNIIANETSDGTGQRGNAINLTTFGTVAVQNNWIGLDRQGNSAPNSGAGIKASGTGRAYIGGGGAGTENIIANNGSSGVLIYTFLGPYTNLYTSGVSVRQNTINNNGGLGIDLTDIVSSGGLFGPDGVTPNDCLDYDRGANGRQNYPELYAPVQNQNGTLRIDTTLKSLPNRQFTVDYYLNNQADPTNYGEGQTWLGSGTMTTNGNSFASASFNTTQQLPVTALITATATDENGNTSEFSCASGVCTAGGTFEDAISLTPEVLTCIQPIIVTTTGNEPDLDGDNPVQNRDGLCDVDGNTSGEQCTLRAAIQEANARAGFDLINFEIPGGGIHVITVPISAPYLPAITEQVEINGDSQRTVQGPLVQLRGEIQGNLEPPYGLYIKSSGVTVRGLALTEFYRGIIVGDTAGSYSDINIESCFIGLNADGTTPPTISGLKGIDISGNASFSNIKIKGNVISNHTAGIFLGGPGVRNVTVVNNKIGTDAQGATPIPNTQGIVIGNGANNNTIGGELESDANVISGNSSVGIIIQSNAFENKVTGNYIGTRADGSTSLPNGLEGIDIEDAHDNTIGGPYAYRNILGPNNASTPQPTGTPQPPAIIVLQSAAQRNIVVGNYIGMAKDGDTPLGGSIGVLVTGSDNTIGGSANAPNVFGVTYAGITVASNHATLTPAINNKITYNRIGTTADGADSSGIDVETQIDTGIFLVGEVLNTNISNNLISGNQFWGIFINDGPTNTNISNNKIGTMLDGSSGSGLANITGIQIVKSTNNQIIGNVMSSLLTNVEIGEDPPSGTPRTGRRFSDLKEFLARLTPQRLDGSGNQYASGNRVQSNRIGLVGALNLIGVKLGENARDNFIGGDRRSGEGNYIAANSLLLPKSAAIYVGYYDDETPNDERRPMGNKIQGNFIGWDLSFQPKPTLYGVVIAGAANNVIGADVNCQPPGCNETDYGNYIGNSRVAGIYLHRQGTIGNYIGANFLGVTNTGAIVGNGMDGILYASDEHNIIKDNIIAGNARDGVRVEGHRSFTLEDNDIAGNGGNGVTVSDTGTPRWGEPQRSDQRPEGGGFPAKIIGNAIGKIDLGGTIINAANSVNGIELINTVNTLVGASASGRRTVVTKSGAAGIKVSGSSSYNIEIGNATVGTDAAGSTGLGNGGDGIRIDSAPNVVIGGAGKGNIISGNTGNGISVENTDNTTIQANSVGVVPLQTNVRLANQKEGISIRNSQNSFVGGAFASVGNVISGNLRNGILISGVNSISNQVLRNAVGTDLYNTSGLGNNENGVRITDGARNNVIGGDVPDNGNTITGNGGSGILLDDGDAAPVTGRITLQSPLANRLVNNNIFGNFGLGIDIFPTGPNPNDTGDADEGPNRGQNYPEIYNVSIDGSGQLAVLYLLDTAPTNANYGANGIKVQFSISDATGQGRIPIATTEYWTLTDYNNGGYKYVVFGNASQLGFQPGSLLTATATDADGNTSEFVPVASAPSPSPTPTASSTATPSVAISGTVTYGNSIGSPTQRFVPNVQMSGAGSVPVSASSDALGAYLLGGFGTGAYTVTPSKSGGTNASLSSYDAALIAQHVVGPPFPSLAGNQLLAADVSGNGEISSFDAAEIAHYVVSNTPVGRSGTWKFSPSSNFYNSLNSSITGADYSALLIGDVSGNWNDPISLPRGQRAVNKGPEQTVTVTAPNIVANMNNEITIPVQIDGVGNKGIIAYEFDLRYDPMAILPKINSVDLNDTVSSRLTAVSNISEPGLLRVAVYGPAPIDNNGLLLNLRFIAVGKQGVVSSITWERILFNEGEPNVNAVNGQVEMRLLLQKE